jgi:hypothetical protein
VAETAAQDAKRYNAGPSVLQACIEEVDAHDRRVEKAKGIVRAAQESLKSLTKQRKDCRARWEGDGIDLHVMDRIREDKKRDPDELAMSNATYARYAAWQQIETGFQSEMDFDTPSEEEAAKTREHNCMLQGEHAAKNGDGRGTNPHEAGTLAYAAWDKGWVTETDAEFEANGAAEPAEDAKPKKRGRPKKGAGAETGPIEIGETQGTA